MDVKTELFFVIFIYLLIESGQSIVYKRKTRTRLDYNGSQVIRFMPKTLSQLSYFRSLHSSSHIVLWLPPTTIGRPVDVMVYPQYRNSFNRQLLRRRIRRYVLIPDVGKRVRKPRNIRKRSLKGGFFRDYQRLDAIFKFLDKIVKQNPQLAAVHSIGTSFEKRNMRQIIIGVNHQSKTKPIIHIDGGMHAREWIGVSTALYIIDQLVKEFNAGQQPTRQLLTKYDFYIAPCVNPDGYEYSHTTDRMWRKNRAKHPGQKCVGTDLNRNFDFHFDGEGSSPNPCKETYRGPKAFSEPESRAISNFVLENKSRIKVFITLHSYGQYFLYPWGWTKANASTAEELRRVANIAAKALFSINKTKYTVGSAAQVLYKSQGSDDWAYGVAKVPYVYCLEMRDLGKHGFVLPPSQIEPTGKETYVGIKALVKAIRIKGPRKRSSKNNSNKKTKKVKVN